MKSVLRFLFILKTVASYRLLRLIPDHWLPTYARILVRLLHGITADRSIDEEAEELSGGVRLRRCLEDLGPIFIKFGQLLSTRRDLMPPAWSAALQPLQDQVAPFSSEAAEAILRNALGTDWGKDFVDFNPQPMASASIAQVHAARLTDGREVVIKLVRPGIQKVIEQDLALMDRFAQLVQWLVPFLRRVQPRSIVEDYRQTILNELNLLQEAANTSKLRRNFHNSPYLYVPEVHWPWCREQVMVMERIHAIPISDIEQLKARGTNMRRLAHRGVEIFFTQVFKDNFFHADMHPGNILVDIKDPQNPRYVALDCAIVGSLSEAHQWFLSNSLLAFFNQDYERVARLYKEFDWVETEISDRALEAAIRSVCEPIFAKPLAEISFGLVWVRLFQIMRDFKFTPPPELLLLQKTLLHIEGLGLQLYPELDLWETGKPHLERWMRQRYGARGLWRRLKARAPFWLEHMPDLPERLLATLENQAAPAPAPSSSKKSRAADYFALSLLALGIALQFETLAPSFTLAQFGLILAGLGVGRLLAR